MSIGQSIGNLLPERIYFMVLFMGKIGEWNAAKKRAESVVYAAQRIIDDPHSTANDVKVATAQRDFGVDYLKRIAN